MKSKFFLFALVAVVLLGLSASSLVYSQVVRFETSSGEFDMVLNPTNNPLLQEHTDNLLDYVQSNRYNCTVINRADENFVLQMGSFRSKTMAVPNTVDGFIPIDTFPPITGVPADQIGLTNSRGTVSLALPGDGMGGTNRNGGTSSFFVNLGDNAFLDTDFTVFAVIPDLTTIDTIMGLNQVDLSMVPGSGANPGDLAFTDIPVLDDDNNMVFIKRAFVVEDTMAATLARNAALAQLADPSLASTEPLFTSATDDALPAVSSSSVPEPGTLVLTLLATLGLLLSQRRR